MRKKPIKPAAADLGPMPSPARCPGCHTKASCLPLGSYGHRFEFVVICERAGCWSGPVGLNERQAIDFWNKVADAAPLVIRPLETDFDECGADAPEICELPFEAASTSNAEGERAPGSALVQ